MIVKKLYEAYIKDTKHEARIVLKRTTICSVKKDIYKVLIQHKKCKGQKVHLHTKSLKHIHDRHIYDKNVPKEFRIIVDNLKNIIEYPDTVFLDKPEKKGDFMLVKEINKQQYLVTIEITRKHEIEIVSASATGKKYLKKFTSLWSWKDG